MKKMPEITALMLYYGRRNVAEEAVESFLRQTYPHKHLLIINTHPDLICFERGYPDIEVHNFNPDPFENLNDKYNYGFSQLRTNWWCPWDSDDIWMPWHMENLADGVPNRRFANPLKVGISQCYFAMNNVIRQFGWNMWTNCIYETLDSKGKLHPVIDPAKFENCDTQILLDMPWQRWWLDDKPPSLIFRWGDDPHGSMVVGEKAPAYHAELRKKIYSVRNNEPFRPHWDIDYVALAKEFNEGHDWRTSKYHRSPNPKEQT